MTDLIGMGEDIRDPSRLTLEDSASIASAQRSAARATIMPTSGAKPAQTREEQFGKMERDVKESKAQVAMAAELLATVLLSSNIPGGAAVAASRYASMTPAMRTAYWALKEVAQPLARYGVIGLGTGAVPLLFGKPMSEAVQTALYTAVGEMIGGGAGKIDEGRAKVVNALSRSMSPQGETAGHVLETLGQKTTVGELTGSEALKRMEDSLRPRLWEGRIGRIQREGEEAISGELLSQEPRIAEAGQVRRRLEEPPAWLNTVEGDVPHPAQLIQNEIETKRVAMKRIVDTPFKEVDELIAGARPDAAPGRPSPYVNISKAQADAHEMLAEAKRAGLSTEGGLGILTDIISKNDSLSFQDAQRLRSDLLAIPRQSADIMPNKARQYADRLIPVIDAAMQRTAMDHGGEVYTKWRQANAGHKAWAERFDNEVVQRIMQAGPDDIMGTIAKPASPYDIRAAREAIDNPVIWGDVQSSWLRTTLEDPAIKDTLTEKVNGKVLLDRLTKFNKEGALGELFPGGHGDTLLTLAKSLAQIQRGGGAAPWNRVVQQVSRGGGLALVLGYEHMHQQASGQYARYEREVKPSRSPWPYVLGAPITIMLSPFVLSRIFSSQKLTRAMLEGTKASPSFQRRVEIAGGIMGLLAEEGLLSQEQEQAQRVGAP
jgi:hypothetical protein